ncbi:MAG: hypothetical protein JXP34_20700 [Planctomycetes bacterium]|nr:hypothetical protein [Planctomycetota bacterium]
MAASHMRKRRYQKPDRRHMDSARQEILTPILEDTVTPLPDLCDRIRDALVDAAQLAIQKDLASVKQLRVETTSEPPLFRMGDDEREYNTCIEVSPDRKTRITIAPVAYDSVGPRNPLQADRVSQTLPGPDQQSGCEFEVPLLDSVCSAQLVVSAQLRPYITRIKETIAQVCTKGSQQGISTIRDRMVQRRSGIVSFLRKRLEAELGEDTARVLLWPVDCEYGIYEMDEEGFESTLTWFRERCGLPAGMTPLKAVSILGSTLLPIAKTLGSQHVLKSGKRQRFQLDGSPYKRELPSFLVAEKLILGTGAISVHPVLTDVSQPRMTIACPEAIAARVQDVLESSETKRGICSLLSNGGLGRPSRLLTEASDIVVFSPMAEGRLQNPSDVRDLAAAKTTVHSLIDAIERMARSSDLACRRLVTRAREQTETISDEKLLGEMVSEAIARWKAGAGPQETLEAVFEIQGD